MVGSFYVVFIFEIKVYFFGENLLGEFVKIIQSYFYNYERLYLDDVKLDKKFFGYLIYFLSSIFYMERH